jgi:GNAT superfamily N-acetyltransferase
MAERLQSCEEWLEMIRDLDEPISIPRPPLELSMRWADKGDLFAISAMEGFVKEMPFLQEALDKGDRCLLLEMDQRLCAFAWVTFRDYGLALWYTLRLHQDWSYLVYIFVHPEWGNRGVGTYLLALLMDALRKQGYIRLLSGMYSDWEVSIRLHTKAGFRVHRRMSQCKILNIFPIPPKEEPQGFR